MTTTPKSPFAGLRKLQKGQTAAIPQTEPQKPKATAKNTAALIPEAVNLTRAPMHSNQRSSYTRGTTRLSAAADVRFREAIIFLAKNGRRASGDGILRTALRQVCPHGQTEAEITISPRFLQLLAEHNGPNETYNARNLTFNFDPAETATIEKLTSAAIIASHATNWKRTDIVRTLLFAMTLNDQFLGLFDTDYKEVRVRRSRVI